MHTRNRNPNLTLMQHTPDQFMDVLVMQIWPNSNTFLHMRKQSNNEVKNCSKDSLTSYSSKYKNTLM